MDTTGHRLGTRAVGTYRLLVPILIGLEFFSGLVQGWIVPLLGEISRVYSVPLGLTSWVLAVGLLSSAVSVPLISILGDRFGPRRLLVVAVSLAAAGSILIALAPNFAWLLVGTAIQGPVAAFLPLAMALLKSHRPQSANRDVGLIVGTLTFGVAAGSIFGGIAMDAIGRLHTVQLIPAIALAVFVPLVLFFVAESQADATRSVDWLGALLLGIGLVGLMYGLSEGSQSGWLAAATVLPIAVGAAALVLFLMVERRALSPIVDIPAMRAAGLANPIFIGFLVALTMFGNQSPPVMFLTANPAELGYGNAMPASGVGLVVAVSAGSLTLGSFLSSMISKKLGRTSTLALSCLAAAAALLCMAFVPSSTLLFALWLAICGVGTGIVVGILPGVVIERSPESAAGSVAGVYNTGRTIGGSLAGAFVASVTTMLVINPGSGAEAAPAPSLAAFQVVWVCFAAVNVVAAAASLFIGRKGATAPAEPASVAAPDAVAS